MKPIRMKKTLVCASLLAASLAGCGGGGSSDSGTGTVTVGVTDAPVDGATSVVVQFTGIELQPASGDRIDITYAAPKVIDLLNLQAGLRDFLLEDQQLAAGQYNWIRLKVQAEADNVMDSYIVVEGGGQYELRVPSGSQTGLKLNTPFTVADGQALDFTIDFDLRKSVHEPKGQKGPGGEDVYMLRPVLRLLVTEATGSITGTIDPAIFGGMTCDANGAYAVYAYDGASVTPDDVDGTDPEPVTTATTTAADGYAYTLAYLEPGDYTVAATCQAGSDDPEVDNSVGNGGNPEVEFVGAANVTVAAGAASPYDFAP